MEDLLRTRFSALPDVDKALVQNTIWQRYKTATTLPLHVKNKLSLLITLLFMNQFPSQWSSFFDDLIHTVTNDDRELLAADLFLRTCICIDEEVVCRLINRTNVRIESNSAIKDAMRLNGIAKLVPFWIALLDRYSSNTPLINAVLIVLAKYSSWIDSSFLIQPSYYQKLRLLVGQEDTRNSVIDCFHELTTKGFIQSSFY